MSIIVVDDEKEIADLVHLILNNEGFEVIKFYNSVEAYQHILNDNLIDLAIIDVMMPGIDGFKLCSKIREAYTYPIIMLTARSEDIDKIMGLSIGADDYITKPFNPLELIARVKAQLRRYKKYDALGVTDTFDAHGMTISKKEHSVTLFGQPVCLTPTEFDILWLLCENAGNVVSSEKIFQEVWKEDYLDSNNTVMVHIRRLREKLQEPSKRPRIIKTVWGVGYKIEK